MEIISEKILFDFFSGKTTLLQRKMIEDWLKQEGNENIYYEHLLKWEKENLQYSSQESTTPDWLLSVFADTCTPRSLEKTILQPAWKRRLLSWKVAATIVMILTATVLFFFSDFLLYKTYQTHYTGIETIQLTDGSSVVLNLNSQLKVPRFSLTQNSPREVWLSGEAFFKVARKKNRQRFIVHTPVVAVEVLGTRFNVSNRHGKSEVMLEEGKVQLFAKQSVRNKTIPSLIMQPGEYVTVQPNDTVLQKKIVKAHQYTSWQYKKLIFEDKPLSEVARTIEDYYGISVRIRNRSLAQRKFTGTLPANDLATVLESLSTMYQLEVEKDKNLIILR